MGLKSSTLLQEEDIEELQNETGCKLKAFCENLRRRVRSFGVICIHGQGLSGSWCTKGTDECMTRVDSSVSLMYHDPDRSWISDPVPDHLKGTHPKLPAQSH